MKKKQIAFVVNGLYGGGAEKVLQVLLNNFDRKEYDITLISHKVEDIKNEYYPIDIKYKGILKNIDNKESKAGRLWVKVYNKINLLIYDNFSPRIFRLLYLRDRFDVEIAFIEGYATRIVSGGSSSKKIAWIHIDLKQNPWTDIAYRSKEEQIKCYSLFDEVVSVSNNVKQAADELFAIKSKVLYNPIDAGDIRIKSSQLSIEKEKDTFLFVSVGRLVAQKGYDRLIHIIGRLKTEGFKLKLWIIGEGTDREYLEEQIKKWKLQDSADLLGYQNNPYPYLAAGDVFVCSSRSEGYSTVVTEALILETPVITTRCAGMEELLDNGKYGIIVANDDIALLDGMRNILRNKRLMKKYKDRVAENRNRFSLQHQMREIYSIINN